MKRRELLKLSLATGGSALAWPACAVGTEEDATPAQFLPHLPHDPAPHTDDLAKYPTCPYCGMDRRYNHNSRMLIHYSNDLPDPLCSIHCGAISLALNLTLDPKAIYVGDNAVAGAPKPLVEVGAATFLVGSDLPGVMTVNSKVAYGTAAAAEAARLTHGGTLMDFRETLKVAFTNLADDVDRIRKAREERLRRAARRQS
jgi:copper chaperone NosL